MPLVIAPHPIPLTENEYGDIRVTGTRIGLEHIVEDYITTTAKVQNKLRWPT